MSTRAYKVKVGVSVGIGLAVIALASGLAAWLLPPPADCVVHSRNPYRFRDWANYVDGIAARGDAACVALISDSQGYAGEYPAQKGYAARLESLLNERKTGGYERWEVLNLSIDGVTSIEYVTLAARLRAEKPTWVVSVSSCADYRSDDLTRGVGYCRTDLPHLLTERAVAARVPFSFWRRHGKVEDLLTAAVAHRLPLLQVRDFLWSWLDIRAPGAQRAFYAPQTTYRFWQLPGQARVEPVPEAAAGGGGKPLDLTYDERAVPLLDEFLEQLAAVPAEHRLVVAAPLRSDYGDSQGGHWIAAFRRDLARLAGEHGLPFRDLTEALPPEDFITSNHLQDRNHKRMAELLADHIAAEMER